MKLIIDFETANTAGIDLKEVGADVYASHPATKVICLCVMREDGEPLLTWMPDTYEECYQQLDDLAADPGVIFEAHNAAFEQMIWQRIMVERHSFEPIPISRWACSMARSFAHGMPGALEKVAKALHLGEQKDMKGADLAYGLSDPITKKDWNTPQSEGGWRPDDWFDTQKTWADLYEPIYDRRPKTLERVARYCMQDCRVEWAIGQVLPELSPYERAVWEYDQIINHRGVKIDRPFVEATIKVIADASAALVSKFQGLTGLNSPGQVAKLIEWVERNGVEVPTKTNSKGVETKTLDAAAIDKLLGEEDAETGVVLRDSKLPPAVHEVLSIRRLLGAAAIKKFPRMLLCAGADGRARYTIQYHGAHTGRWAGRLFQPQNFPRTLLPDFLDPEKKLDPEVAVAAFLTGNHRFVEDFLGMSAIKAAGRVLRHALIAGDGRVYDSADFAGIEMRIALALAGQQDLIDILAAGHSPYIVAAEAIYGRPINKSADLAEYTIGKHTILGCGFGMGAAKFHARYCPNQTLEFAERVIQTYRNETAPKVPRLWDDLETCALEAVLHPGQEFTARCRITYVKRTDLAWLQCILPDGQVMWYREPRLCTGKFGNQAWQYKVHRGMGGGGNGAGVTNNRGEDEDTAYDKNEQYRLRGQDDWVNAYGGLLTENVCQKLARGLLCEAIARLEHNGFPVVLTVHDEILAEPEKGSDHEAFEQIMSERPAWAANLPSPLPIAVEGWQGPRYRK